MLNEPVSAFTPEVWAEDFAYLLTQSSLCSVDDIPDLLRDRIEERETVANTDWYERCLCQAYGYFQDNREALLQDDIAVVGTTGYLFKNELLAALYVAFFSRPIKTDGWDPEAIVGLARILESQSKQEPN